MNQSALPHTPPRAAIFALALGAFAIGLSEFVIMGLLPEVSAAMNVSLAQGSHFISYYALGVVVGAPLFSLLTTQLKRKTQLMLFISLFLGGNLISVFATNAGMLVMARFISGLPHGAFLGVAALAAASLADERHRGRAVGSVMMGLTVASLLGNPLATMLGESINWRWAFALVSLLSFADALLIFRFLPAQSQGTTSSPLAEVRGLWNLRIWLTLGIAAIGFGGMFAVISYIAPVVVQAQLASWWLPLILFAFGLGMVIGNLVGGKLADRKIMLSIFAILLWSILVLMLFAQLANSGPGILLGAFLVGTNLALCAPLQVRLMQVAGQAQTLAATLNHSAFNIANALGASLGAWVVNSGHSMSTTATWGAVLPLLGLLIFFAALLRDQRQKSPVSEAL